MIHLHDTAHDELFVNKQSNTAEELDNKHICVMDRAFSVLTYFAAQEDWTRMKVTAGESAAAAKSSMPRCKQGWDSRYLAMLIPETVQ